MPQQPHTSTAASKSSLPPASPWLLSRGYLECQVRSRKVVVGFAKKIYIPPAPSSSNSPYPGNLLSNCCRLMPTLPRSHGLGSPPSTERTSTLRGLPSSLTSPGRLGGLASWPGEFLGQGTTRICSDAPSVSELEKVGWGLRIGAPKLEVLGTPPSRKGEELGCWVTDVPQLDLRPPSLPRFPPQCLLLFSPQKSC